MTTRCSGALLALATLSTATTPPAHASPREGTEITCVSGTHRTHKAELTGSDCTEPKGTGAPFTFRFGVLVHDSGPQYGLHRTRNARLVCTSAKPSEEQEHHWSVTGCITS